MSDGEMTPAKWLMLAGAIVAIAVAIGVVYVRSRGPEPAVPAIGDKGDLLRDVAGPGTPTPSASEGADEVKSFKGRRGGEPMPTP